MLFPADGGAPPPPPLSAGSKKPSALRSGVARELNPPSLSSHMTTAWSGWVWIGDGVVGGKDVGTDDGCVERKRR